MDIAQKGLPNYDVVPLRKEDIAIAVVQSEIRTVDANNPKEDIKYNVDHLCWLIDQAAGWGGKDLLVFHEFPISGYMGTWTRAQADAVAVMVPGPEIEALQKKAQQHKLYVSLGGYMRLPDWPGHFMNMGLILGPNGDIVYKHWKARNMSGMGFSTTVYDVLDKYVEKYGWDAVLPVARTDIGNIAIMPEVHEPEMARAFALKGVEILIRYMTGGALEIYRNELQAQCAASKHYGVFVNQAVSYHNRYMEDTWAGLSAVMDPDGIIVAQASSHHETVVNTTIPLAAYRKKHSIPYIPKDLFIGQYNEYVPKFPANCFSKEMPNNIPESMALYTKLANW